MTLDKKIKRIRSDLLDVVTELNKEALLNGRDYYEAYYRGMTDLLMVFEEVFNGLK